MKLPGLVGFRLCSLSNKELSERVAEGLEQMYVSGKVPGRRVPAQPNNDFDLLVGELVYRFCKLQEDGTK